MGTSADSAEDDDDICYDDDYDYEYDYYCPECHECGTCSVDCFLCEALNDDT